jgi:acetylornithine deacetylase
MTPQLTQATSPAVDELTADLVELTRDLIRIPTETHPPHGDEGPGQRFLDRYLRERLGWETDVFLPTDVEGIESHPGWWPGWEYTDRPNVVATRKGIGGGRSLILNGHMDVVAAGDRSLWTHEPYGAELVDGRIYGRGAMDMKCGIAAMIFAVRAIERAGIRLRGDVTLESVVNEELGGYNGTLACCVRGYEADAAIVTEPTGCRVMPAHKGGQGLRLHVPGRGAHANWWYHGVSALDKAILLKQTLAAFEAERAAETRDNPYFSDPVEFPISAMVDTVWALSAGDPELMSTPQDAVLDFWLDALPGERLDDVLARLRQRLEAAADADPFLKENRPTLSRHTFMRPFEATAVALDHPIVRTLEESYQAVEGRPATTFGMAGVCDAMIFNLYSSTPAVIFGPGGAGAHAPDEYVDVESLVLATKVLAGAIMAWCGTA